MSETSGPAYASARESALLDRAFTRAAGAPLVSGNAVRLLKDAEENYPAWLEAIHSARQKIYFENYFICDDRIGREFAAALAERARAGVRVRLVHDWVGSMGKASRRFWRSLTDAGVEVRVFNPLKLTSPMDVLHRDHRKVLAVDSRIGFITGLCVGDMWMGDEKRGIAPWRDTGVEVRGPALCDIERAFSHVWDAIGDPLAPDGVVAREALLEAGDVSLRIVANEPGTTGIFRLDQLIAAAARRTLWLTDAYFAGVAPYVQALRAAAKDGVDVRLLVPGATDIPLLRPLSQAGFRPLLEAGIRVFEWKGPMLHAKTAVADGRWARVGSSNLNVASWIGNYELDCVIEHEAFAAEMENLYLADLENSTEIVLEPRRRRQPDRDAAPRAQADAEFIGRTQAERESAARWQPDREPAAGATSPRGPVHRDVFSAIRPRGSASRAAAGALRVGRTLTAALSEQRVLARTDARFIGLFGLALLAIAVAGILWPLALIAPLAILLIWIGLVLLVRAFALRRQRCSQGLPSTRVRPASSPPQARA